MKMTKKKILVVSLVICALAILSMGTIAWFNSTASVVNTFMFDDTDNDGSPDFKVQIFETKNSVEVDHNDYPHVAPGAKLPKDPTVRNIGDYAMYTRMVVTLSGADAWIKMSDKYSIADDDLLILEKMVDIHTNWQRFDNPVYDATTDTLTYVYYHNGIVEMGIQTAPLFTQVNIPTAPQQDDMRFVDDKFNITVKADAIQSDNIIPTGATIVGNEAYTAFSSANWAAGVNYPQP